MGGPAGVLTRDRRAGPARPAVQRRSEGATAGGGGPAQVDREPTGEPHQHEDQATQCPDGEL